MIETLVLDSGSIYKRETTTSYSGWRAKYGSEGGNQSDKNNPAVVPSVNAPPITFTSDKQWLSWNLMYSQNKLMNSKNWASVYNGDTAFTNQNGWDNEKDWDDQRRDYVNDANKGYPDPKLMKAIICAGSFYRGIPKNGELWMYPGVHAIDANKGMPSISTIINNNWYFHATINTPIISHFSQGQGGKVVVAYFLREPTPYPLNWFEEWNKPYLPDPIKTYANN
jgi:hypothetical protein